MSVSIELSRRDALLLIVAASATVAGGCAMFRNESELDAVIDELDELLSTVDDIDSLKPLASALSRDAKSIAEEHAAFTREFNQLAENREASDESLVELFGNYERRRVALRTELLRSQDALEAAWPEETRADLQSILNRKVQLALPQRRQGV